VSKDAAVRHMKKTWSSREAVQLVGSEDGNGKGPHACGPWDLGTCFFWPGAPVA
jgi:hypothetical protein